MTLYVGEEFYDSSNDLNDLLSAVEKLPFHDRFYSKCLYVDCHRFYIVSNDKSINEHNITGYDKPKKVELQDNILLIAEDLQHKKIDTICVSKDTTEDSILNFLSRTPKDKIEVAIVGGNNIKNQFCADRNANALKVLNTLVNYQHGDVIINNSCIYNNVNNQKLVKVDRDALDNEKLLEWEKSKTPSKKPLIYGVGTSLAFSAIAAALYFSSFIAYTTALVLVAASIVAGVIVGLVTHYYTMPNQKLEGMKAPINIPKQIEI